MLWSSPEIGFSTSGLLIRTPLIWSHSSLSSTVVLLSLASKQTCLGTGTPTDSRMAYTRRRSNSNSCFSRLLKTCGLRRDA